MDPKKTKWLPKNVQIRVPEMSPRFWVLPSMFLIGGPKNGSRLRPQKWVRGFTKKSKNVPRVNKLGPKRKPKVVYGEGEQLLGP